MNYTEGGFSLSLRRHSWTSQARGIWNISRHFVVDKGMNFVLGEKWRDMKASMAQKRAPVVKSREQVEHS